MTVIWLPDEQVAALKANAAGLTLEAWLKQLADAERQPPPAERPLQTAADIVRIRSIGLFWRMFPTARTSGL